MQKECEYEKCGKTFHTRKTRNKYCSRSCYCLASRKRITVTCTNCNVQFETVPSRERGKHGYRFCGEECKNEAQRLDKQICPELKSYLAGTKTAEHHKRYFKNIKNAKCASCEETKKYKLMIHHIDGNKRNNVIDNYEIVCANCHVVRHLEQKSDGEWFYNSKALTPRELIPNLI